MNTVLETIGQLSAQIEHTEIIEFSQQQYFAPIYSREWYKTQIYRQACEVLCVGVADVVFFHLSFCFYLFLCRFIICQLCKNAY